MKRILLLALAWPLVFVWLSWVVIQVSRGRSLQLAEEGGVLLVQSVIAAAPFVVLWLFARSHAHEPGSGPGLRAAGGLMATVSLLLWGWFFLAGITARGGGADIGLGILLLFSPVYLPLLLPVGYRFGRAGARRMPRH